MASFLHQLKVLLWKNWLGVFRQPVWSVVLILWPVVIFVILAITRNQYPPTQTSDCYLAPRNLQSTGMVAFLQNFLCDSDTKCSNKSYVPNTATSRSRLQKRSVNYDGGGFLYQMRSSNNQSSTLQNSTAGENWNSIFNNISAAMTVVEKLSSGNVKGAFCTAITLLPTTQQSTFQTFCSSSQSMTSFVLGALFSQASGSDIFTKIQSIATQIENVQNKAAFWNMLLMLPEWFKNPSLIYKGELNLSFPEISPEIADLQSCINYIVKTAYQGQNQSSANQLGNLKTVLNQSTTSDMKSCISLLQKVPTGSSQSWLEMEETFAKMYWMVSSLSNRTPSNVCKFNGLNMTCNGTINLDDFFQSLSELANKISSGDSEVIMRYVQRVWIIIKENRIDELILQQLEQNITNPQLKTVLTQLLHLVFNTTGNLITESNTSQVLQSLLDQTNVLVDLDLLNIQSLNSTGIVTILTQSIVKEVQYLMNLSGLLSISNVSSPVQSLVELQALINSLNTINSKISSLNGTTLLQILAVINQPAFQEFQHTLNLYPIDSNITKTVIQAFHLVVELMSTPSLTNSSALVDMYIKEILQFLNTDVTLVNNLAFLNSYLNYTQLNFLQSKAFKSYAGNILSFFTPSNLQKISSNPSNISLELLKLISAFIPTEEKENFQKIQSIFPTLVDLVSTCQTEFSNCSSNIIVFQQQLSDIMQYINDLNSENTKANYISAKFVNLSSGEIAIVNTIFQMISCSQAHENFSCTIKQDFYNTIVGKVSSLINMQLGSDSHLTSTLPKLDQIKENINNLLQVFRSVDIKNVTSYLDNITKLSECYTNTPVSSMQCTIEQSLILVDFLQTLPFAQPVHDTLLAASSIVKNWLEAINGTADIYQQLTNLYNLSSMGFHNQSTLLEMHTNLLYIVQQLEKITENVNLTSLATRQSIEDLIWTLKLANISYTFPPSLLSQTSQGLEILKTQLQTIEWYIALVKNETDAFQTSGNIDAFVTITQVIINNVLSSIKSNPSLAPIADDIQNVMIWLQNSQIIPALQSILQDTLQNGGQSLNILVNHTVSVIEMIIQQEFANGTFWTPLLNDITENDLTFVVQLLQTYQNEQLTNFSSVLLFTEKALAIMVSLANDSHSETNFNQNLQTVYNISQEVIGIFLNAEHNSSISKNVFYSIYNVLLEAWNGSIFGEFPMLKKRLMDLLYLSMKCLSDGTESTSSQNCSVTDIINVTQLILLDFNNQTTFVFSNTEDNITMNNILEYMFKNLSIANPEFAITEELGCLTKMLNITLQLVSRVNNHFSLNSTWIPEMDEALVKITEKFSSLNITCLAIDKNIIYQLFENQPDFLQSLLPLLWNQTLYSPSASQYVEYIDEMFNIIKLYAATHGPLSLNNTLVTIWNDTLFQLLRSNSNSSEWMRVSAIINMLSNISTHIEGSEDFSAVISRVANLTITSLHLSTNLSHVSLANIFENNFSTFMYNVIKQVTLEQNVTSIESCENTLLNLISSFQSNMNLSLREPFYSNMSSWACSMLFSNISASDWLGELRTITNMILSLQSGAQTNATMKIISSFIEFMTFTNTNTFENFVTSIIETFPGKEPQANVIVFQSLHDLIMSLQSLVTQVLSNENSNSASTVEKAAIQVIKAANIFLKSFNITGYDEIFAFASNILQVYFDFRNSTLPLENLAQKILGQILTSFQESGLQNAFIQSVQSQILSLSSEEQNIVQEFLSIFVSAINNTISDIALQPPSYNNNLVFNIIENIIKNFNRTHAIESLGGNQNLTELIFSLASDILQIAQNWNNVSLSIAFPQNGSNEALNNLEGLLNNLLSQNLSDKELYYNYSTTLLNVFGAIFLESEKDQIMQTIQYLLNLSNGAINVPALVNTLENFYDLLHLNKTVDQNILGLYIKQLFSFISSSQINQTFSEISYLFNTIQKLSSLQNSEIGNAALEFLPFFQPSSLYNISIGNDSLISILLNVLSKNMPLDQQYAIKNFTDTILSLMELIDQCNNNSIFCDSAISAFETLAINVVNVFTNMENGTFNLEISNETLKELETLSSLQISLINNMFSLFWNVQNTTYNFSGDLTNVYQNILLASKLIMNITKASNSSTVKSDLEILKNYTEFIGIIQNTASVNNITQTFIQIMQLQKDFHCANQTLLCMVNFTSHFLGFLQTLQVPKSLMEQILAASSIAEYWLGEINTMDDVYQQMVSLYKFTKAALQNKPTLQTILWTLSDISKFIQDMKTDNASLSMVKDLMSNILKVLQEANLNTSTSLQVNMTLLENMQTQIKIIEWYIVSIKNQTENQNFSGDPYALYRLIQISLIDMISSIQNWSEFPNMSNQSSHTIVELIQLLIRNETEAISQIENLVHLSDILQQITSTQSLEFTTIWQVIDRLMSGELNMTQKDGILKVVQAAIKAQNITEGAEIMQLYNFFLEILNQTYSIGKMNLAQFFQTSLESFLTMDCQSVSKAFTAIYKMIMINTNQTSSWEEEIFFSNLTLDTCHLLHWNNSLYDWLTLLQTSRVFISYVTPLVPDSISKYFNATEYILAVAAEILEQPNLTQNNLMNILNVVPVINELFNNSAMDWVQNDMFQKLLSFLLDLAWTSSSPKDILLLKVQNFIFTMVQDIQDMIKTQPASPYSAWVSFALETVKSIMNSTQDPSSDTRLLKQVWDLFKQSGLETVIISTFNELLKNSSASSENTKLLDQLLQLVFNVTDSVISDTPLNLSYSSTTIKALQMALKTFLPQYENFALELAGLQSETNITKILSELQLLLNSMNTMQILTNVTNTEANLYSLISQYVQMIFSSNDTQYMKLFLDAQKIFNEFAKMNTTITVQELSAIFANHLSMYVGSSNETQASLYTILNMWQYLNNLTGMPSNEVSNTITQILPVFQSLLNDSTNVSDLMPWLVNAFSDLIPAADQDAFHKVANITQHLIETVQTCSVSKLTCPNLIEGVQNFVSDVSQLETFMQNKSLANSYFLHFGLYNESQITLINEIYLLLSYAMGHPYNASLNGVYGDVLTLKDWIFNTTMEHNLNFTTTLSPQSIAEVLNTVNITTLLLQVENVLQISTCVNQTDKDEVFCKLNVVLQLTQLLNQLPLEHTIHGNLSIISSMLRQWTDNFNTSILIYQQLIDLYNVTVLTLQYQPTLQTVNATLINLMNILYDRGILQNSNINETDIVTHILLDIIQQLEFGPNTYNLSSVLQYNISELLTSIQFQLDIVNWLMLHVDNQTGLFANSSEVNIIYTVVQWLVNNSQAINIIIRDIESVVSSFSHLSPDISIDAFKILVEDLLNMFLPQNEDEHLKETLQILLNVTNILVDVTGPNMINKIHMFINNIFTLQSDISNDPTKLLNLLSAMNQTGLISKIKEFIEFLVSSDIQLIQSFWDALKTINDFAQVNNTINVQDLSAMLVKYLQFVPGTTNDIQISLNAILNLWQYLNNMTDGQSMNQSITAMQMLPFLESHILINENTNISEIMSWIIDIISRQVPEEQYRLEKAANASLLVFKAMEACVSKPGTCTEVIKVMQNFFADVVQLETLIQNRTLVNASLLLSESYNQSQIVFLINELFIMLSSATGHSYNISTSQNGVFEDLLTLKNILLNTTMENLNLTIPVSLKGLSEIFTLANNSQILLQAETLITSSLCTNQTYMEPFLCRIHMTLQIAQFLSQLPLAQTTHDKILTISKIVTQWLSNLDNNMPTYQHLIELYNTTVIAFDQHFTLQAINSSLVNIALKLIDMGILQNVTFNETDMAMTILSEMIQLFNSESGIHNLSSVLQYNISGSLEAIQSKLQTFNLLMIQFANNSLTRDTISSIVQWIQNNNQHISLILKDVQLMINAFDSLQNILSMNWTISNNDLFLSLQETMKRAVVFIDGFMNLKALENYEAISSLVKDAIFSVLFNVTNSQLLNTTVFSVAECTSVVKAVANLSSSVWPMLNRTQLNLEDILSNFGVLACNTLYVQSANYSWSSNLEVINNILSNMANYVPAAMTGYFTATEKIISFLFENFQSPNISQEKLLNSIYELFIQELKIFSNSTITADWLEKIPVRNLTSVLITSGNIATFDQALALEADLLHLLSRSLNATSYSQGISVLSDSLSNMTSSFSGLTQSSGITNQLTNVVRKFTVTVQIAPLTEPYGTVMNCVKNVANNLTNQQTGQIDMAIQDLFTQSSELANGSMVSEILNQKLYQLQNLTSIVCGLIGLNSSESSCYVSCQYLTVLNEVVGIATAGLQVVRTAQNFSVATVESLLNGIYLGLENELNVLMSSVLPVSDISNITSFISSFANVTNVTSSDAQATLGSIFHNRSYVEEKLRLVVKLSQPSITALMNVQIPSNKTDISGWFVTLYQCSTNLSLVAEPLQIYCNLSSDQGYQMAIIFLQNVDVLQLSYRLLMPSTLQTSIDIILAALNSFIKQIDDIFQNMPSLSELNSLLNIMKNLIGGQSGSTRRRRSVDSPASLITRAATASAPSFTDIAKYLCNGNYSALYLLYPTLVQSKNQNNERAQTLEDIYGIPTDNAFCSSLFSNLVKTSSGATYWMLLKPVLYGNILYAPHTTDTEKIMNMTNSKLQEVQYYKDTINAISTQLQSLINNWNYITGAMTIMNQLQDILNSTAITGFLQEFLQVNTTELLGKLSTANSYIEFLNANKAYIRPSQILTEILDKLLSCVSYNRIQPFNSVSEMMAKAQELQNSNDLFAAVTFHLPSGTSRVKRSASGLPKQISYSITMRSLLSEDTSSVRSSYWTPGPHNTVNKYSRGFVYLQENIDRAIIELQTNMSTDNVGVQYQPMPYPCYKKNSFLYSMSFTLPIALMITWVLFIAAFVKKLVHEKELRLHEYMKMMGINSCSHFFAWFIECAFFLTVTVAILVLILKFGKVLPQSNGFIMFLFFLDYSFTVIAMSYLISVFFHNTNVAALSGSLIYIITFFPFIVVVSKESGLSFAGKTLLSIFSPTALSYATQYIIRYEEQDEGIQWHNMYTSPVINDTFSFGWLCWIMVIDAMIYFIVGWYIRIVFPGKYGIGSPWYFPILPSFWMECCGLQNLRSTKPKGLKISNLVAHGIQDKKGDDLYPYNEKEPTDVSVGVSLHGLTKIYQSKAAVENLNLNFYEGHITSLLGHNGAGKTTTLSMLTGLFSASSGTIYVYGNDIRTHLDQARKNMGVCMQYDVLFDHLTTKEHLLLYGSIKAPQWNKRQLHEEVKRTLKDTGLYRHRYKPVKALSGGMRRKLSICIALIGGSKVVILDEPTTGVDPCSRRSIWEVISKNKKDKTIILSTHHLDEAEVLSDRIAFLEKGGLKCCGTPRFLKEKFGSGYRLTLTKKFPNQEDTKVCNSEKVTGLIQSHIPEARLKEDVGGELVYVLPPFRAEISGAYLSLLHDLDTSMNDLHIGCYGISDTTIEEVFLKLTDGLDEDEEQFSRAVPISGKDALVVDDESSTNSYSFFDRDDQPLTRMENVTGFKLLLKKTMAMFIKRFHNSKRNWKGLISQILLPVLFVIAAMGLGSLSIGYAEYPELLLSPELYGSTDQSVVFGISNKTSEDLMNAMSSFPGIDNVCLDQNSKCLQESDLGPWNYIGNQTLPYGTCDCSTGYTVCNAPNAIPPHRMTYSKQMMYNLTGKSLENYLLTTTLQFIQKRYGGWSFGNPSSQVTSIEPLSQDMTLSKVWYNNEGPHSLPAFLNSFSNFLLRANLPSTEASQYSISVSSKPLPGTVSQGTTTTILVNTLVALSILVGYSITTASFVTYVVKEHDNGSKRLQHIAGFGEALYWLTNFLYDLAIYFMPVALSIAMIAAFKLPAFYNYPNLGAMALLFILFGYATFPWMYLIAGTFKNPGMAFISYVCINLFIGINTIISSSVVYMLTQIKSPTDKDYQSLINTYNTLTNVFKIFPQFCFGYGMIELSQQQALQDQLQVYGDYEHPNVFGMDILGYMYVAMAAQGTFCFILRLLINDGIIYSVKTFFKKTCLKNYRVAVKNLEEDEDVTSERERVEIGKANGDLLVLQGLTKVFHQVKGNMIAVNNMTLGIPPGECFGLLGVNGAGKTTTFKMLTGDISPSSGNIQVQNHLGNLVNVLGFNTDWSSFGYCPQEDALDELMTGEEHLYYYARIHGIPERRIKYVTNQLLQKLQLVQYKNRITANYSCGTRRKLSTALALVGKPSILLLDEPSSGMDPKTKRHLWKIISEEVREKCAVILTSHSMEECEALCTRLAIMVRGKFQCIGSLQHIKSRFGSGFTVKMHLKDTSVSIETITNFMHLHFPNTYLKEQHFTMAEYHVPVSAGGVASIFDLLESNKRTLNIIHFSVSQTTLDEVFINFAQSQSSPDNSRESSQEVPQQVVVA